MPFASHLEVMVVDDTSVSRALIVNALEEIGIKRVRVENDGKAALTSLAQRPAHLVISDYNMPGLNGIDLLRAVREGPGTRGVGFILVTGRGDKALIDEGRKFGLNNYLAKPFTTPAMRACIEAVTGKIT